MSLLDKLLPKKHGIVHREMPSWEEIVAHMQGKELSFFADTIVRVIDSKDHAKRVIILRSDHGYYKTVYEEIRVWDEDEWNYFCNDPDRYPPKSPECESVQDFYFLPFHYSLFTKSAFRTFGK